MLQSLCYWWEPEHEDNARAAFGDTNIVIKTDGIRHLGDALGSPEFCGSSAMTNVKEWEGKIQKLAGIAATKLQGAYVVYTSVLRHKWSFFERTMLNIAGQLEHLESTLSTRVLTSSIGLS